MNHMRDLLFDLLCNAVVEIAIFAIAAALLAPLLRKMRPVHLHLVYLAIACLCLAAPIKNTLRQPASVLSPIPQYRGEVATQALSSGISAQWFWPGRPEAEGARFRPSPETKYFVLVSWLALVLYGLLRFVGGLLRIRELRASGRPLHTEHPVAQGQNTTLATLLKSEALETPVTVGVFRPVILLPEKLLSRMDEYELQVVLAHESAHIRRSDFATHLIVQILTLPVAWHPGMRYITKRISQARELACDEDAATQLGRRRSYARALLRLSALCVGGRNSNAVQVGVFDGSNLEERIMLLMKRNSTLSGPRLAGLLVATTITFGSGAILARAMSLQTSQQQISAQSFVGTWHWMVRGQPFATMILKPGGNGVSGTVTQSHIGLAGDGSLDIADPVPNAAPAEISEASVTGSVLHVKTTDGFAFSVTLTDGTHASIQPVGAPPNMKPILAERVK